MKDHSRSAALARPEQTVEPSNSGEPETRADLIERLGSVPLHRIRLDPPPGTAAEADVLTRDDGNKRLCELVDGVLIDKEPDFYKSVLGAVLVGRLEGFVHARDLGITLGPALPVRLAPGLVRMPEASFRSWRHFPGRRLPRTEFLEKSPDLTVNILTTGNTPAEMARKLREYLDAGVRLIWYLDPVSRSATVYRADGTTAMVPESGSLDGEDVVPGFSLALREWFLAAGEQEDPE